MRILLAADTYTPSINGAANFTKRLAVGLAQAGHEVAVIAPATTLHSSQMVDQGVTEYRIWSIPIPIYPDFRIAAFIVARQAIKKAVLDFKPDVVHVQSHFTIGKGTILAAKALQIRVVGTNHFMPENLIHYFPAAHIIENSLKSFGWWQFRQVYDRVDLITTPTKTAAKILAHIGIKQTVQAISCGIDCVRFSPGTPRADIKTRYKIPTDKPIILYVGRLDQEKQIDVVIRALPIVLQKQPAHLVLAGLGKERQNLETLVQSLGLTEHVTFTGYVPDDDLPDILRSADVFVMASLVELQSIATLEALATGLPVVLADALALPELVIAGENGYLFPPGDSEALAAHLTAILSDETKRQAMGARSLELSHQHDIHQVIKRFGELYQNLVSAKSS